MLPHLASRREPPTPTLARILFVGDVVGPLGLATVEALLPRLRSAHQVDFCVANGENSDDDGAGISRSGAARLFAAGVDVITSGNHAFDAADAEELYASAWPVVRPDGLAGPDVGRATITVERDGIRLGVVNVIGSSEGVVPRSPCAGAEDAVARVRAAADVVIVDVHAGWPAEKLAVAWELDGQVCAVVGTHTHVPTADARVLPRGTAYISDVGMTGAADSLIGFRPDDMVRQSRHPSAPLPAPEVRGDGILMGALITAGADGRAETIEHIQAHMTRDAPAVRDTGRARSPRSRPAVAPVAAAVFDCDGLLVDTAHCWRAAYTRVLQAAGRPRADGLLDRLNGASVAGAAAILDVDPRSLELELRRALLARPLRARPGARTLLRRLDGRLPVAVASNAPADLVRIALGGAGLAEHLPLVIGADGLAPKPAPDVFLAACDRLDVAPRHAVALEDSPVGAAAARAAGLRLVYVPSGVRGAVVPDVEARRLDDREVLALFEEALTRPDPAATASSRRSAPRPATHGRT